MRRWRRRHDAARVCCRIAEAGVRGLRRIAPRRAGKLRLCRVRRARRPDPQGSAAGRVRGRQHEAAGRAAPGGAGGPAGHVRGQPPGGCRARRRQPRREPRRPRATGGAHRGRCADGARRLLHARDHRAPGAARQLADRAQHPLERAGRRRRDRQGGAGRGGRRLRVRDRRARCGWPPAGHRDPRPAATAGGLRGGRRRGDRPHRGRARIRGGPARGRWRTRPARAGFEPPPAP